MTRRVRAVAVGCAAATAIAVLGACSDDDGDQAKVATTTPTTMASDSVPGPDGQTSPVPEGDTVSPGDGGAPPDASGTDAGGGGAAAGGGAASTGGDAPAGDGVEPAPADATPRTGEACGSQDVLDGDGYAEGRADAEAGHPFHIDGVPPPGPEDTDDDQSTVGPAGRYQAAYSQGWCDGGGAGAPDDGGVGSTVN